MTPGHWLGQKASGLAVLLALLSMAVAGLSCAPESPAEQVRDQVLEQLEQGGLQARAEQGSVTWSFGKGGPVRVGYDFATGGEPYIPFPLVIEGDRLYLSGELMDGADPQDWILLTPELARDLWQDAAVGQEDKELAQTILAFVRYGDPRRLLSSIDMASARLQEGGDSTRLSGSARGETILGRQVPPETREWLHAQLAFPRIVQVVLEVGEDGRPLSLTATGSAEEGQQVYSWTAGPLEVPVPEQTGDFRDWVAARRR